MRTWICAVLLVSFAAAAPARAQEGGGSDQWDARITATTGDVTVHPADGSADVDAEVGMPLAQGDRIVTSADSTAEISLDGGSLLTLSANSDFTLSDTRKSASVFSLTLGSLMAKIQKLGSESLSIRSPTSVAAVRGTEFGVDVDVDGGQSHVGVFDEGRVEVGGSGAKEILGPNQETSVARGQAPTRASALSRFSGRRQAMRDHVRRLEEVRRSWKPLPLSQRRAARARALRRGRARRAVRRSARRQQRRQAPKKSSKKRNP